MNLGIESTSEHKKAALLVSAQKGMEMLRSVFVHTEKQLASFGDTTLRVADSVDSLAGEVSDTKEIETDATSRLSKRYRKRKQTAYALAQYVHNTRHEVASTLKYVAQYARELSEMEGYIERQRGLVEKIAANISVTHVRVYINTNRLNGNLANSVGALTSKVGKFTKTSENSAGALFNLNKGIFHLTDSYIVLVQVMQRNNQELKKVSQWVSAFCSSVSQDTPPSGAGDADGMEPAVSRQSIPAPGNFGHGMTLPGSNDGTSSSVPQDTPPRGAGDADGMEPAVSRQSIPAPGNFGHGMTLPGSNDGTSSSVLQDTPPRGAGDADGMEPAVSRQNIPASGNFGHGMALPGLNDGTTGLASFGFDLNPNPPSWQAKSTDTAAAFGAAVRNRDLNLDEELDAEQVRDYGYTDFLSTVAHKSNRRRDSFERSNDGFLMRVPPGIDLSEEKKQKIIRKLGNISTSLYNYIAISKEHLNTQMEVYDSVAKDTEKLKKHKQRKTHELGVGVANNTITMLAGEGHKILSMATEINALEEVEAQEALAQMETRASEYDEQMKIKVELARQAGQETTELEKQAEQGKQAIRKKIRKKEHEIELKRFRFDKKMRLAQAGMNAAAGIMNGLSAPFPLNIVQALVAATMGAAQIGVIAQTPEPSLASGGIVPAQGEFGGAYRLGDKNKAETVIPFDIRTIQKASSSHTEMDLSELQIYGHGDGQEFIYQLHTAIEEKKAIGVIYE